jgi:hypothetical protein
MAKKRVSAETAETLEMLTRMRESANIANARPVQRSPNVTGGVGAYANPALIDRAVADAQMKTYYEMGRITKAQYMEYLGVEAPKPPSQKEQLFDLIMAKLGIDANDLESGADKLAALLTGNKPAVSELDDDAAWEQAVNTTEMISSEADSAVEVEIPDDMVRRRTVKAPPKAPVIDMNDFVESDSGLLIPGSMRLSIDAYVDETMLDDIANESWESISL